MTEPDTLAGHPPLNTNPAPFRSEPENFPMRTHPATPTEVDSWLTVLHQNGHLYRAQSGPDSTWTVQRTRHSRPWTLHHPVLAMDWIEDLVREVRQQKPETLR